MLIHQRCEAAALCEHKFAAPLFVRSHEMRILILVNGTIGARLAGPAIRGWELARALAAEHDVTVACERPDAAERDGVRLVPSTRGRLTREARRHDAVMASALPPYLFAALRGTRTLTVSDQYDPIQLEMSIFDDQPGIERAMRSQNAIRRLQLRFADVIACAGQRQRDLLEDELESIDRGPLGPPEIVTVPFGLAPSPGPIPKGALRSRFDPIAAADPLVLWWGKVWRWFDAPTAIEAFARVVAKRPDARLVISAGKAPNAAFDRSETTTEARQVAGELDLLDRNVFFLDEWFPYERRHELLGDADLGITLHGDTAEAPYAARARYMDYLWAGLPPVLATGDEISQRFADAGFAKLVHPGDAAAAAARILELIEEPGALATARASGRTLADEFRWTAVAAPLAAAIARATGRENRAGGRDLITATGTYYLRRAVDHGVEMTAGRHPDPPAGSSRDDAAFVA